MRHAHIPSDKLADIEALRCQVTAVNSGLQILHRLWRLE